MSRMIHYTTISRFNDGPGRDIEIRTTVADVMHGEKVFQQIKLGVDLLAPGLTQRSYDSLDRWLHRDVLSKPMPRLSWRRGL